MTPKYASRYPQEVLTVCVALIEYHYADEAISTLAHYLNVHDADVGATGLLAFALLSHGQLEEAEIVVQQAFTYITKQRQPIPQQVTALEGVADYIRDHKRSSRYLPKASSSERSAAHFDQHEYSQEDLTESPTYDLGKLGLVHHPNTDTIRDEKLSVTLKMVDQVAQQMSQGDAQHIAHPDESTLGGQQSDTIMNLSSIEIEDDLDESKVTEIIQHPAEEIIEDSLVIAQEERAEHRGSTQHTKRSQDDTRRNLVRSLPTSVLRERRGPRRDYIEVDSESYIFDEDLLSELGLSSVRDTENDTSEIDSSVISQLEQFTQHAEWDHNVSSLPRAETLLLNQPPVDQDSIDYDDTSRFVLSELESALISADDVLTENHTKPDGQMQSTDSIPDPIADPLLYPLSVDDEPEPSKESLLAQGEIIDRATTQWVKPKTTRVEPMIPAHAHLASQNDTERTQGQQPDPYVASHVGAVSQRSQTSAPSPFAPEAQPQAPLVQPQAHHYALVTSEPQGVSELSALRRLADGDLNVDTFPPPIPSSQSPRDRERGSDGRAEQSGHRKGSMNYLRWLMGIGCIIGSYLTLVSAFHSKSGHLIQHASVQAHTLSLNVYRDLERELYTSAQHPIGQSIDILRPFLNSTQLYKRRDELFHKLAWVSTARWVLHGESGQMPIALYALKRALMGNAQRVEGRAALALTLWISGQDVAAQAVIQALPRTEWRRDLVLGWIDWRAKRFEEAQTHFRQSHQINPNNELIAQLLGLIRAKQGIAIAMPYLQQLKHRPTTTEELGVYLVDLTSARENWATPARLNLLSIQAPQLQREILEQVLPTLFKRGDRVSLQSLVSRLKLSSASPSPLLLPTLMISLTELDLSSAQQLLREIYLRFERGTLRGDDVLLAQSLWVSLGQSPLASTPEDLKSLRAPKLAHELGDVAGRSVAKLITDTYHLHPRLIELTQATISLGEGKWVQLDRIASKRKLTEPQGQLWRALSALSRAHVSVSQRDAQSTLDLIGDVAATFESALLLQADLLRGLMIAQIDPSRQGQVVLSHYETRTTLPLFKWLARSWRCEILKNVTALGRWINTCESALRLNPQDLRSLQQLALALEEMGRIGEAQKIIQNVPLLSLNKEAQRLKLRFLPPQDLNQTPTALNTYQELLSAERGLRLSTFVRLAQQELPRLSRHEAYRASWVMRTFSSAQSEHIFNQSAIRKGSIRAKLNERRVRLMVAAAKRDQKLSDLTLDGETRLEANAETRLIHFVALYDALVCLASHKALDVHHYHPSLRLNLNKAKSAFRGVRVNQASRKCQSKITDATSSLESSQTPQLPVVVLSQVQLLISVGQKEQAYQLLKELIDREPTLIEARLAQALLLMRSERQPESALVREVLGPILDPTQGAHIPTAMYQRLKSWGGI